MTDNPRHPNAPIEKVAIRGEVMASTAKALLIYVESERRSFWVSRRLVTDHMDGKFTVPSWVMEVRGGDENCGTIRAQLGLVIPTNTYL